MIAIKKYILIAIPIVLFLIMLPKIYTPKTMPMFVLFSAIEAPIGLVRDVIYKNIFLHINNENSNLIFPSEIIRISCESTGQYMTAPELLKQSRLQLFIDKLNLGLLDTIELCNTPKGELLFKYGKKYFAWGHFNYLYSIKDDEPKKIMSLGGNVRLYMDSEQNLYFIIRVDTDDVYYEFDGENLKKINKYKTQKVEVLCPSDKNPEGKCASFYAY